LGPPTLLAGIYGMNFEYLPGASAPAGLWIFAGIQLVVAIVVGIHLMRRGLP